jgi:hypothetical protein
MSLHAATCSPKMSGLFVEMTVERTGYVHRATVKFRGKYFSASAVGRQTCKPLPASNTSQHFQTGDAALFLDPTIAVHHGRVVKRTGDGTLVEFRSVVDAVRCAIEVQNGMVERNAGLPPERRIEFRGP